MTIAELIQKLHRANLPLSHSQIICLYSPEKCPACDHQQTGFRVVTEEAVEVLTYYKIKCAREFFYKYPNDEEEEEDEEVK